MSETYLNNVDIAKVEGLVSSTTTNVSYFNRLCNDIVQQQSEALDNLMKDLYVECIKSKNAPTNTLERYYLELSNMIYFMGEKLERLSIYDDMSKEAAKEVYAKAYLNTQVKDVVDKKNKTTVAECQAAADMASQYENIVNSVYSHAFKVLKYKIESGKDMMNTLRKIISRRMSEEQLSLSQPRFGSDSAISRVVNDD